MPGPSHEDTTRGDAAGPVARSRTPVDLLAALVAVDPTRPRLTWYDDVDGPTRGERIELSGRVIATWAAKAANLLVDELDVQRGEAVQLELPPHWRAVYWALACWRVGAAVTTDGDEPAAVRVTTTPDPEAVTGTPQVAVSLPALARSWTPPPGGGPLPAGVLDEAAELATYGDVFEPYDEPGPKDVALGGRTSQGLLDGCRALATERGWGAQERVAVTVPADGDLSNALEAVLAAWTVDGSVVLVRGPADPDALAARWTAERVTSAYDPAGRPASRS